MHLFCYYPSLTLCALKSSKEKKKQTNEKNILRDVRVANENNKF